MVSCDKQQPNANRNLTLQQQDLYKISTLDRQKYFNKKRLKGYFDVWYINKLTDCCLTSHEQYHKVFS